MSAIDLPAGVLILLLAILFVARIWRLSAVEITVLVLPMMTYVPVAGRMNVSLADLLLPVLAWQALARPPHSVGSRASRFSLVYAFGIVSATAFAAWLAHLTHPEAVFAYSAGALLKVFVIAGYLVLVPPLAAESVRRDSARIPRLWVWMCSALACMAVATAQLGLPLMRTFGGVRGDHERVSGSFEDPNLFAAYLLTGFCLVPLAHRSGWLRLVNWCAISGGVVATGSRAGLLVLGLAAVGLGVALLLEKTRTHGQVVPPSSWAMALVFLGLTAAALLLGGAPRLLSSVDAEGDVRFFLWGIAIQAWRESPVVGVGPGQFVSISADALNAGGLVTHSTYLAWLVEQGLVGIVVWVSLFVLAVVMTCTSNRSGSLYWAIGLVTMMISMSSLDLSNARFTYVLAVLGILSCACEAPHRALETSVSGLERDDPNGRRPRRE